MYQYIEPQWSELLLYDRYLTMSILYQLLDSDLDDCERLRFNK